MRSRGGRYLRVRGSSENMLSGGWLSCGLNNLRRLMGPQPGSESDPRTDQRGNRFEFCTEDPTHRRRLFVSCRAPNEYCMD